MADKEISDLTAATSLDNTELVHVQQGGNSRQAALSLVIPTFHGCRLVNASDKTTQDLSGSVTLTWDTETFDTDAFHSTSTNTGRITIPSTFNGMYGEASGTLHLDLHASGTYVNITLAHKDSLDANKHLWMQMNEVTTTVARIGITTGPVLLATGDYFELIAQTESDTSVTITAARSTFGFKLLGQ